MSVTLNHITFDCADAARVAGFWSSVLDQTGRPGRHAGLRDHHEPARRPSWMFIKVPEAKQRQEPGPRRPRHGRPRRRARAPHGLGATHLADLDEGGTRWTTLADPEGNEFDVVQTAG